MQAKRILEAGADHLSKLPGHVFDVVTISQPASLEAAIQLSKTLSKLSSFLGNLIEFKVVEYLNQSGRFEGNGRWIRQDPQFPDVKFTGGVSPTPGFEIKVWFPLATEMTARFYHTQKYLRDGATSVCLLSWMPEHVIYGKPKILSCCVVPGLSIAETRDRHYHNPPDYLVLEPEDTTSRPSNLKQFNTTGHRWQGTSAELEKANKVVNSWGCDGRSYQPASEYQQRLTDLSNKYRYRLDTNYAKIDRIQHPEIEAFKAEVLDTTMYGVTIQRWANLFNKGTEAEIQAHLSEHLKITE